jgi:hypothetical protein
MFEIPCSCAAVALNLEGASEDAPSWKAGLAPPSIYGALP